jgi:hypothetical protein
VPIIDIAGNVESGGKPGRTQAHDEETGEIYLVKIFGIKKEVGYSQVLTKTSRYHGEKYDPTQQQDKIAFYVVQEKLNRKGINDNRK